MSLKSKFAITTTLLIFILASCSNQSDKKKADLTDAEVEVIKDVTAFDKDKATATLKVQCYSCHDPNAASLDEMLAPPLASIKYKYKEHYGSREAFIEKMTAFVMDPTEDKAIMIDPLEEYGIMNKTTLTTKEEVYKLIAFIHDSPLDYPDWFPAHFEEQEGKPWE